jgi:hypothetical protein
MTTERCKRRSCRGKNNPWPHCHSNPSVWSGARSLCKSSDGGDRLAAFRRCVSGSFFTFTGSNYPANSTASVTLNGQEIGAVAIDSGGGTSFILNTYNLDPGLYTVAATVNANATALASFEIILDAPLRSPEGDGPIFNALPTVYLPVLAHSGP